MQIHISLGLTFRGCLCITSTCILSKIYNLLSIDSSSNVTTGHVSDCTLWYYWGRRQGYQFPNTILVFLWQNTELEKKKNKI